jgi:hypothetical protein
LKTTEPDVAGAVLALDQAMIALAVAKSVLLGETSAPMPLASLRDRPHYADPSAAGQSLQFCAEKNTDGGLCTRLWGHDGDHASRGTHTRWPQGHLDGTAGHQLRSISIPSGGAA